MHFSLRPPLLLVVQGEGHGEAAPPLLFPEKVDAGVGGQAVEPGGKGALPVELLQAPPCVEKSLLGQLRPVVRVPGEAAAQVIDPFFIVCDQLLKG